MRTCYYEEDFTYPESGVHFHVYNADFPEMHDHDYWEFFTILSGETKHVGEINAQTLVAGTGVLVHPWDKHKFIAAAHNYSQMNVMITDDYFRELLGIIDPKQYELLVSVKHPIYYEIDSSALKELIKTVHALQTIDDKETDKFINLVKCIWLDIIKLIYRSDLHANYDYPEWLNDFIQKMRLPENISKPVSELCSLTYFSYSHLTRLFRQYTGETLSNYLSTLRLNYGAMLLRTTDMSVLSISSSVGYDSLSHFMRMFKKRFNMTPKQYKRSFVYKPEANKNTPPPRKKADDASDPPQKNRSPDPN